MRVVEPSNFKKAPEPQKPRSNKFIFVLVGIFVLAGVFFLRPNQATSPDDSTAVQSEQTSNETIDTPEDDELLPGELRTFSGNEFKIFYFESLNS